MGNDSYQRLCRAIGAPELATDPDFLDAASRERNRDRMNAAIDVATAERTSAEWVEILNRAGVPAGPIYKLDEMFADPQVKETGIVQTLAHPMLGDVEVLGMPIEMSRTPAQLRRAPPTLGEHTDEVMRALGYDDAGIARLRADGIV